MTHRIVTVHFERRENHGPLTCSCGEQMDSDEFSAHRKALGLYTSGQMRLPDDERERPTVWRRSIHS